MERAASNIREGEITGFEPMAGLGTPGLAYVVWIERGRGKIGERDEVVAFPLRVTTIFRPEDDTWKIVHRHPHLLPAPRPPDDDLVLVPIQLSVDRLVEGEPVYALKGAVYLFPQLQEGLGVAGDLDGEGEENCLRLPDV